MRLAFLLTALLATGAGWTAEEAQLPAAGNGAEAEPLWEWYLAGFARYGAAYPGSSENQVDALPLPFPRYRGRYLRLGEDAQKPIRGILFRRDRIKLDLDFDVTFGTDSEDIDVRQGMPDTDFLLEAGPQLSLQFIGFTAPSRWRAYLNLPLRAATSWDGLDPSYRGVVFAPELSLRRLLTERPTDRIRFRLRSSFASQDYMDYYYGVAPAFETLSRPSYDAGSGYLSTELSVSLRHRISSRWEFVAGTQVAFLDGARNRNSPLLVDDVNYSVYAVLLWKFWESERRAEVSDDEIL